MINFSMISLVYVYLSLIYTLINGDSGIASRWGDGNPDGNNCGYNGVPTSSFPYGYYAAVAGDLWDDGYGCGACYKITCVGAAPNNNGCGCTSTPTVTIQIVDQCGGTCNGYAFDMEATSHDRISTCGETLISYERVNCDYTNNIVIRNKEGTTISWYGFHVDNVAGRGSLELIKIISSDYSTEYECTRTQPSFWLCNGQLSLDDFPYHVRFIDDAGNELFVENMIQNAYPYAEFNAGTNF